MNIIAASRNSPKLTTNFTVPDKSLNITIPRIINIAARIKLSNIILHSLNYYLMFVVLKIGFVYFSVGVYFFENFYYLRLEVCSSLYCVFCVALVYLDVFGCFF